MELEGMPRHASTHAAGVVITKEPVESYVPLQKVMTALLHNTP
jgi:DNA polymerase-3 subunit alpha